ncbi:hypothetical protein ABLU22_12935, partial [Acinetobacter lwoffii]
SVICGPIGCAVDFVCRLLHLKIISLKKPLQIGLCNKAFGNSNHAGQAVDNYTLAVTNTAVDATQLAGNYTDRYLIKAYY